MARLVSSVPMRVAALVIALVVTIGAAIDVYRIGDSGAKAVMAVGLQAERHRAPFLAAVSLRVPAAGRGLSGHGWRVGRGGRGQVYAGGQAEGDEGVR